jgi:hypothetical protein
MGPHSWRLGQRVWSAVVGLDSSWRFGRAQLGAKPPVLWAPPPYTALCKLSSSSYNPTVRMEALAPLPPPSEQPLGVRVDSALRGPLAVAALMQTRRRGGS